jgi:DNA-binding response OmpR family regulator
MRLLIADSDPTMAELYDSYFSNNNFQVTTVGNGVQCIDAIRRKMPDVLVLEHKLPWGGDDGVIECLQQDFPFACPEIVLLTKDKSFEDLSNRKLLLAAAYLHKPFMMRDLFKLIQRIGVPDTSAAR